MIKCINICRDWHWPVSFFVHTAEENDKCHSDE